MTRSGPQAVAAAAWHASPPLVVFTVLSLAFAAGSATGLALDARTLDGVPVWLKPVDRIG